MNETVKRHLISAAITFLGGFLGTLAVVFDNASGWDEITFSAFFAAVFVGARLLVKFTSEEIFKIKK